MNHSDEQIPLLTMQIEYTNLGLESSYVYLAIYVLQIVVEKLLLTFLCKKPHTLFNEVSVLSEAKIYPKM